MTLSFDNHPLRIVAGQAGNGQHASQYFYWVHIQAMSKQHLQFKRNIMVSANGGLSNIEKVNCCSFLSKPEKLTTSQRLATRKEGWVGRSQYEVRQLLAMMMVKFYLQETLKSQSIVVFETIICSLGHQPMSDTMTEHFIKAFLSAFCNCVTLSSALVQTLMVACEAICSCESENCITN